MNRGPPPRGVLSTAGMNAMRSPRGRPPPRRPPPSMMRGRPSRPMRPRGPPPRRRGPPGRGMPRAIPRGMPPRRAPPPRFRARAPPRGMRPRGPSPRAMRPRGPPPRSMRPRGPPPRSMRPRGPPPRSMRPRGPSPRAMRPRGPPPRSMRPRGPPPRSMRPRGPPPRSMRPRGPPPRSMRPRGPRPMARPRMPSRGLPPRRPPARGMMVRPRGVPPRGRPRFPIPARPRPGLVARSPRPIFQRPPRSSIPMRAPDLRKTLPVSGPPRGHFGKSKLSSTQQSAFGTLTVTCLNGLDLRMPSAGSSSGDMYCKMRLGNIEHTTQVAHDTSNPRWGDTFSWEVANEMSLVIEVFEKNKSGGKDTFVGSTTVSIAAWIKNGSYTGNVALFDSNEQGCGSVRVSVKFERAAGSKQQKMSSSALTVPKRPVAQKKPQKYEAARDPNGKFTDQEIKEAFDAFDLDHNNFVGAAEIRHVLINIGEQPTDEEVDEMIRMVDTDGDGQVSFVEFYEMVTGGKKPPIGLGGESKVSAAGADGTLSKGRGKVSTLGERKERHSALDDFASENHIKPETVKRAYKRFRATDSDGSGMIDYTEFCEVLQVDPSPQVEKLFQLFDKDRSGQIDVREFMIGLQNYTGAGKDERLKFAFTVFDEDGNGVITKQELIKILKANHMATHDREVMRKADTIMAQADKDGDGVVDFDEFVIISKKFPNILFPAFSLAQKMKKKLN